MATLKGTKEFFKELKKTGLEEKFAKAANKALEGAGDIDKKSGYDNLYSLRLNADYRVLMIKDDSGDMVPMKVGKHADYDKWLKQPKGTYDYDNIKHKITEKDLPRMNGDFNKVSQIGGMQASSKVKSLIGDLAERAGMIGGIAAGAYTILSGGSAKAAMQEIVPGASSTIAAMDGQEFEAFLRGIEELPLGFAATEFIRPLARAIYDDADIDPGLLEQEQLMAKAQAHAGPDFVT